MHCPICGNKTEAGGLWISGTLVRWLPEEDLNKSTFLKVYYPNAKLVAGKTNHLLKETKIPNAHYCAACRKIIGVFDMDE